MDFGGALPSVAGAILTTTTDKENTMTLDATNSINEFRRRQLAEADNIIARASQLCERVLAEAGDQADSRIVQLQHDCADWSSKWSDVPAVPSENDYEGAMR